MLSTISQSTILYPHSPTDLPYHFNHSTSHDDLSNRVSIVGQKEIINHITQTEIPEQSLNYWFSDKWKTFIDRTQTIIRATDSLFSLPGASAQTIDEEVAKKDLLLVKQTMQNFRAQLNSINNTLIQCRQNKTSIQHELEAAQMENKQFQQDIIALTDTLAEMQNNLTQTETEVSRCQSEKNHPSNRNWTAFEMDNDTDQLPFLECNNNPHFNLPARDPLSIAAGFLVGVMSTVLSFVFIKTRFCKKESHDFSKLQEANEYKNEEDKTSSHIVLTPLPS